MAEGTAEGKVAFELVAPERVLTASAVDMVVVPGAGGDFGVLPQHSLLMSVVRPGVIEAFEGNTVEQRIFVAGGFAEVNETSCTVLAEEAMLVDRIDLETARRRLANARDDLSEAKDDVERARLEREIEIAEAMIAAGGG
jgi:F-type H+-transporting ATPase subunit epsilon